MTNFLNDNLLTIILFLLLIILLLIAFIGLVLVKLLMAPKKAEVSAPVTVIEPIVEEFKKMKKISEETIVEKYFCENHKSIASVGTCLICEDVFCEQCLIEHESLYFCKEHFKVFANNKWKQITDIKTTPATPEDGLFIYQFKRQLWKDEKTPMFVLTHYKINIEEDFIESFIQLNVIENDADKLQAEIENFKAKH